MFIIRPVEKNDLDGMMELLEVSGHGLTSLPKDRKVIERKIINSVRFVETIDEGPNGQSFLFVMVEVFTGKIVGVCGVIAKIGGFEPYYFYRLEEETYSSEMMKVEKSVQTLHVEKTHSGPSEICSLFLHPEFRNSQNGRFLSLSRFLFIREFRSLFEDEVVAEMRGRVNADGMSPFWEAVGRHFFNIDFVDADYLTLKSKKFIEELLPTYPIIVDLLPAEAKDVVAEVHPNTAPAKRILEKEGFGFSGLVGIFEPGPVLTAKTDSIRAVAESHQATVDVIEKEKFDGEVQVIGTSEKAFKATLGHIKVVDGKATIEAVVATALDLRLGDKIRYVGLKKAE